jgi:L-alanine-DL-glutamate epimerase-like enolase superfamily enzyme
MTAPMSATSQAATIHAADIGAASVPAARIARVEIIPLCMPLKSAVKISDGGARQFVDTLLVCLHTDSGVSGVGETQAWRRQGGSETHASLCSVIRDHFEPHLLGASPFSIAAIMNRLERTICHSLYAQAAVADALYDLQGKLLGVPVHALLGGKCRDALAAAAILFIKPTVAATLEGAQEFYDRGFRSFTVKVGVDLQQDIATVAGLRQRFGDGVVIRVDANAGMDFDSAALLLRKLETYDLDAAEQLLPIWDVAGLAELARRTATPLMIDESLATDADLIAVIRQRAGTVIHTKVAKNGGIWGMRKLWTIASAAGMRIYPGNHPSTSIATLSVLHLAAAWPGPLLEGAFAVGIENLAADIVRRPVQMQGNRAIVPDEPGLGVTLDEDLLREFAAQA